MRVLLLSLILWSGFSQEAQAQLRVISGDHATFSRLVVLSRDLPDWKIGQVDGGYEMRLQASDPRFLVDTVFDLIGKSRVSQVLDRGDGTLFLSVICDCRINAFEIEAGLVIDVIDQEDQSQNTIDLAFDERTGSGSETPKIGSQLPDTLELSLFSSPNRFIQPRAPLQSVEAMATATRALDPMLLEDANPETLREIAIAAEDTAQYSRRLIEEFGQAATLGLISLDTGSARPPEAERPDYELSEQEAEKRRLDTSYSLDQHVDLTSVLISETTDPVFPEIDDDTLNCYSNDSLDLHRWGDYATVNDEFSLNRSEIYQELEELDIHALESLAKSYIFLGFGVEAINLLEKYAEKSENSQILIYIAEIIDHRMPNRELLGVEHLTCESRAALWSFLAQPKLTDETKVAKQSVFLAFSELPFHLKEHLGSVLVDRFLMIGDKDSAEMIVDSISRESVFPNIAIQQMKLDIETANGRNSPNIDHLLERIGLDGPPTTDISIFLHKSESGHDDDRPDRSRESGILPETKNYNFEKINKKINLYLSSQDYVSAFQFINYGYENKLINGSQLSKLNRDIIEHFAKFSDDNEFLASIIGNGEEFILNIDLEMQKIIFRRLFDLGVGAIIQEFQSNLKGDDADLDSRVLFVGQPLVSKTKNDIDSVDNNEVDENLTNELGFADLQRDSRYENKDKFMNYDGNISANNIDIASFEKANNIIEEIIYINERITKILDK